MSFADAQMNTFSIGRLVKMLADIQPLYADRSKIPPRSLELWNSLTPDMQEMLIPTKLQEGVWLIDGFNPEFLCATELDRSYESMSYGVCDSVEDIFNSEEFSGIVNGPEKVTIFLTEVNRADQPEQGGWRWHKWGPYIGSYEPQHGRMIYGKEKRDVGDFQEDLQEE